jgi:hypothetical protein
MRATPHRTQKERPIGGKEFEQKVASLFRKYQIFSSVSLETSFFHFMNNVASLSFISSSSRLGVLAVAILAIGTSNPVMATDLPANVDGGLHRLINEPQASRGAASSASRQKAERRIVRDEQGRVRVNVQLDGKAPLAQIREQLIATGGKVVAESSTYRHGVLTVFMSREKVAEAARLRGVLSISLSRAPVRNTGSAISGGVFVLRSDVVNNQGFDGSGITVGILSDSYDTATTDSEGNPLTIHAAQDVASGDLPGPGNPAGNTDPVNVLEDYPASSDEGRAMLQIVHDVAPKAKLAFATAYVSEVGYADNIRKLRTDANCDIICDDVFYTEEPFFSDGIIAQAVHDVVTKPSPDLAGKKCAYFASAGNQQGGGYLSTFAPVSDATARAGLAGQNLDLSQVPAALTSGGFHNFQTVAGKPADISQTFLIFAESAWDLTFQWNDPFDKPGGVTTNYNILIFDAEGNYLPQFSGVADNFATQRALEDIVVQNASFEDTEFQIVITRAGTSPATPTARKIRYLAQSGGNGVGGSEHYQPSAPATFGHSTSVDAISVAAYVYDDFPSNPVAPPFTPLEDFTSAGPATIDFDASGNRLATSQIRQKPDIAAPTGGNNTFFGFDYEGDGIPNFFGTSAAAPHAAGVGALLLQKAGGPTTRSPEQIEADLKASPLGTHDIDPFFSQAIAGPTKKSGSRASAKVTGFGNSSDPSSRDPNFFTVTLPSAARGESIVELTIDLTSAGLEFDSTVFSGFPFTLGTLKGLTPANIITNVRGEDPSIASITLKFTRGAFVAGDSVSFGIDRDYIGDGLGNGADLMEGGMISVQTTKGGLRGTFTNLYGTGWTIVDGFGLIDAVKAASFVP